MTKLVKNLLKDYKRVEEMNPDMYAWNCENYGKELADLQVMLTDLTCYFTDKCLAGEDVTDLRSTVKSFSDYCWNKCPEKYFWRGDSYYYSLEK